MPILIPDLYAGDDSAPNWNKLKASATNYAGAILKATEGVSYGHATTWFAPNWPKVRDAGGDQYGVSWFRGAYHYLIFSDDPVAQADFYLKTIDDAGGWGAGDLAPVVDVERGKQGGVNHDASKAAVIDCTSKFVARIKAVLGDQVPVMLYGRGAMFDLGIDDQMGCDYLWAPQYGKALKDTTPIGWPSDLVAFWQYTDGTDNFTAYPKKADGIAQCDISIFRPSDDLADLRATLLWWKQPDPGA